MRLFTTALTACALGLFLATTASGGSYYMSSQSPHWEVGNISTRLSSACKRGLFNQIESYRVRIAFVGPEGRGVVGYARKGYNLYDPLDLSEDGFGYHFYKDGFSSCRVYVAAIAGG